MSLLLDALRSTESDLGSGVEPEAPEPQERALDGPVPPAAPEPLEALEPLDGPATLALLVSKTGAQTALSLLPASSNATDPQASAPPVGLALAGLEPVAETALTVPHPERAPGAAAGRTVGAPAPGSKAAATENTRAAISAPAVKPRAKTYALAGAALAAFVGIAIVGKSLWWPSANAIVYPAAGEVQQTPPAVAPETTPSVAAVQVSSARPAGQFADTGNTPEINTRHTGATASATAAANAISPQDAVAPANAIPLANTIPPATAIPQARATPSPSATFVARRGAAVRAPTATLSVMRSEGPSPIDRHVQAGYLALSTGNVAKAQTEYFAALELDPNNVDALMGVATVAARDGNSKAAASAYTKVLKLEPGNPDATAAMAALGANGSTGENNESQLKILIANGDGGRPALHAALAGVYAADSRWPEAAQEYFTALAKDPGNPDLAFNVAASLDQNRNPAMALTYYGQALAFARQRPTQIDVHALEQRIAQLQARAVHAPGTPETP